MQTETQHIGRWESGPLESVLSALGSTGSPWPLGSEAAGQKKKPSICQWRGPATQRPPRAPEAFPLSGTTWLAWPGWSAESFELWVKDGGPADGWMGPALSCTDRMRKRRALSLSFSLSLSLSLCPCLWKNICMYTIKLVLLAGWGEKGS